MGGNTSAPTISLAVMRTVPSMARPRPEAERSKAAALAAISSAKGASASAASVGASPWRDRMKSAEPSPASSASIWRASVGCVRLSACAAADSDFSRNTARKLR